ncbi:MAG: hypothetical protein WD768_12265 [Phycisphaeraceae bacterium]
MLFFQVLLLGGYTYAHLLNTRLGPRMQMTVHLSLLAVAMVFMPLVPRGAALDLPTDGGSPVMAILLTLAIQVGLPYFILSSTGPLLQAWFGRQRPGQSPYRLYALSNVGSLAALLTYPLLIEPAISLNAQGWCWTVGFIGFALMAGWCAMRFGTDKVLAAPVPIAAAEAIAVNPGASSSQAKPSLPALESATVNLSPSAQVFAWLGLSAIGSMMLLAVTNQICLDLAPIPLLWVMPLAIYLITFIISFDRETWYRRIVFVPLLAVCIFFVNRIMHERSEFSLWFQIFAFCMTLFAACMVCHGELVRLKPPTRRLTAFYLSISAGGAIGGFIVAVIAPLVFVDLWEFQIALLAAFLVAALCVCLGIVRQLSPSKQRLSYIAAVALWVALAFSMYTSAATPFVYYTENVRNFYGVLHLGERVDPINGQSSELIHGTTRHGVQYFAGNRRRWPTAYYGYDSGAGLAVEFLAYRDGPDKLRVPVHIGVIGLGAGTMNAHLTGRDSIVYYEIDAEIERFARKYFTFIVDSKARTEVLLGDARVVMKREVDAGKLQKFDVLCVDAFTSDSIPIHLITSEAVAIYDQQVKHDTGVIAFHISNRYLDLLPVIRGLGAARGMKVVPIHSVEEQWNGTSEALWVLLTRNEAMTQDRRIQLAAELGESKQEATITWTDDFASIRDIIYINRRPSNGRWSNVPNSGRFVHDSAGLMPKDAARELQWKLRAMFLETGSRYPLQLVTDVKVPRGQNLGETADEYASKLFGLYQLGGGIDKAVMLMVLKEGGQIRLQLGTAWPESMYPRFMAVVNEVVLPGIEAAKNPGDMARVLDEAMSRLGQIVYEEYTAGR